MVPLPSGNLSISEDIFDFLQWEWDREYGNEVGITTLDREQRCN